MTSGAGTLICLPQTQKQTRTQTQGGLNPLAFPCPITLLISQSQTEPARTTIGTVTTTMGTTTTELVRWGCVNKLENTCFFRGTRRQMSALCVCLCECVCVYVMKISTILCRLHNLWGLASYGCGLPLPLPLPPPGFSCLLRLCPRVIYAFCYLAAFRGFLLLRVGSARRDAVPDREWRGMREEG